MSALLFWIMALWRIHPWCSKFTLSCWKSVYTSSLDDLHHYQYGSDRFMDEELKVMWSSQAIRGQLGVLHVKEKKISKYPVNYQLPQTYTEINTGLNQIESFYWTTKADNKQCKGCLSDTCKHCEITDSVYVMQGLTEWAETFGEICDLFNAADRWKEPHVSKAGLVTPIWQTLWHCKLVALNWSYFTLHSHVKH